MEITKMDQISENGVKCGKESDRSSWNPFGSLRRSIRDFGKSRLFRIPATPRLVRRRNTAGEVMNTEGGSIGVTAGWKYIDSNSDYAVPNFKSPTDLNPGPWFGSVSSVRSTRQRPSLDAVLNPLHRLRPQLSLNPDLSPSARLMADDGKLRAEVEQLRSENVQEMANDIKKVRIRADDTTSYYSPVLERRQHIYAQSVEPSPVMKRKKWWRKEKTPTTPQLGRKQVPLRAESLTMSPRVPPRTESLPTSPIAFKQNRCGANPTDHYFDTLNLSDEYDNEPPTPAEAREDLFNRLECILSPITSPAPSRRFFPGSSETSRGVGQASQESLMSLMSSSAGTSGLGQSPMSPRRLKNNPRSMSSGGSSFGDPCTSKFFPQNGLAHRRVHNRNSALSINHAPSSVCLVNPPALPSQLHIRPLYDPNTLTDGYELDSPFLGREWVLRDIHETLIRQGVQTNDWTPSLRAVLIHGYSGCGKTALMKHMAYHSPFHYPSTSEQHHQSSKTSFDSGCIVGSRASLDMAMNADQPSRRSADYLDQVAKRIVAYHFCRVEMSNACSLPEFICNLAAQLATCGQLTAYADYLAANELIQKLLVLENCLKNNVADTFIRAVCEPLKLLKPPEKGPFLILVDGLDEAEYHRPENGDSIGTFLVKYTNMLPAWLKMVLTVRSDSTSVLEAIGCRISLDNSMLDERVFRDAHLYVNYRLSKCPQLRQAVSVTSGSHVDNTLDPIGHFADHITSLARGNLLYLRLTLDLLQQGHVRVKSASYSVLPVSLQEVFQLIFNLKFASQRAFERIVPILSITLASLRPLTANQLFNILNAGKMADTSITWEEFCERLLRLGDLVVQSSDDSYVLFHPAFRDWLTHRHETHSAKFLADQKLGHVLLALWMSRQGRLDSDAIQELGHHILKAHPFKHMKATESAATSRECQLMWVQQSSSDISKALCSYRNMTSPNTKVSRLLLLSGADANACLPNGYPLLCTAAESGQAEMCSLLIEFGADVTMCDPEYARTPLMLTAAAGYLDIVQMLHQHGAKLCRLDSSKKCALVLAAERGHVAIVSFLLQCDWSVHREKATATYPIVSNRQQAAQQAFVAAASKGKTKVCEFLLEMGDVLLEGVDPSSGESALCAACSTAQAETVQYLLKKGAVFGPHLPSTSSALPLSRWGSAQTPAILTRASSIANPEDVFNKQTNPLLCAVIGGSWEIVSGLLSRGLNVDEQNSPGAITPLMAAAKHGHIGVMELLLSRDARVDLCDAQGRTPLHYACEFDQPACVGLLLDRGARVDIIDKKGNTALIIAAQSSSKHVVQVLLDRGAKLESIDGKGTRALDLAVKNENISALQAFLRKGAKLASSTWALASTRPKVALILLNKLFDDGSLLYRRGRVKDACQRFTYALRKFPSDLNSAESCPNQGTSVDTPEEIVDTELRKSALLLKYKILLGLARCQRRLGELGRASDTCTQAALCSQLHIPDENSTGFEAYFLRAKCYFDAQDMPAARRDAEEALRLCPTSPEARHLLHSLTVPSDALSHTGTVGNGHEHDIQIHSPLMVHDAEDDHMNPRMLKSNSPADCSSDSGNQADMEERRALIT